MPFCSARRKVMRITRALLKRLSLKAPKNCVKKRGRKRLVVNNENCVLMLAPPINQSINVLISCFFFINSKNKNLF